jgi:hypothetical protein
MSKIVNFWLKNCYFLLNLMVVTSQTCQFFPLLIYKFCIDGLVRGITAAIEHPKVFFFLNKNKSEYDGDNLIILRIVSSDFMVGD